PLRLPVASRAGRTAPVALSSQLQINHVSVRGTALDVARHIKYPVLDLFGGADPGIPPEQVQAILDLRLQKLTGLEHEKLIEEYQEKLAEIAEYLNILGDPEKLKAVIRGELEQALAAGFDPKRMSFAGPAKTRAELEAAVSAGVGCISTESTRELLECASAARVTGVRAS
ncbi:hypothetical protein B4Q13_25185, partial [Lacticaseibacillus rhamnosus]